MGGGKGWGEGVRGVGGGVIPQAYQPDVKAAMN